MAVMVVIANRRSESDVSKLRNGRDRAAKKCLLSRTAEKISDEDFHANGPRIVRVLTPDAARGLVVIKC